MVNKELCVGCGTCAGVCPVEAITMEDNFPVIDKDKCIKCGACADACPVAAITVDEE